MSKTLFLRGVSVVVAMSVYGSAIAYWTKDDLPEVTTGPMNAAESVQVLSVSFAVKSKPKPVMQPESFQKSLVKSEPKPEVMSVPEPKPVPEPVSKPEPAKTKTPVVVEPNIEKPAFISVQETSSDIDSTEKDIVQPLEQVEEHVDIVEVAEPLKIEEVALEETEQERSPTDNAQNDYLAAQGLAADVTGLNDDVIFDPQFKAPPSPPSYPRLARKRGLEGIVWVDIWLDSRGEQTRLEVFDSSGFALLDKAAVNAVSQWQFEPKKLSGLTLASRVRVPVEFQLN